MQNNCSEMQASWPNKLQHADESLMVLNHMRNSEEVSSRRSQKCILPNLQLLLKAIRQRHLVSNACVARTIAFVTITLGLSTGKLTVWVRDPSAV